MKKMLLTIVMGTLLWTTPGNVNAADGNVKTTDEPALVEPNEPLIQMAILLDTSSSMSGLIEQAKTQLWTIVNEFALARRQGKIPVLQVALYEYGKDSIPADEGYLRMIVPLTTDLDKVSQELFALRTNGGQEYCGAVIQAAVQGLQWSKNSNDFKVIFIAGNEPFTQGQVPYKDACKAAIEKNIVINTIHCGDAQTGIDSKWKDGALLADGQYMHIDQNRVAVYIEAPQDSDITRLGLELNKTYLAYGQQGQAAAENQSTQDENAMTSSAKGAVQRAVTKSSGQYRNSAWDLVDALRENQVQWEQVEEKDLPQEMQEMDQAQRRQYVAAKQKERNEIQKKIQELNQQRRDYVAAEMKKRADQGEDTLEVVIIKTIRKQVTQNHFTFSRKVTIPEPKTEQ